MSMDEQARIEGSELDALLDIMKVISERRDITGTLRVCVDDGALKIKIDEGVWSPPIGYWDARSVPDKSHSVATESITWAVNEAHAEAIRKQYPDADIQIMPEPHNADSGVNCLRQNFLPALPPCACKTDASCVQRNADSVAPCPTQPICYCDGAGRHIRGENCVAP